MKTRCICGIVGRKGWGTRGWGTRFLVRRRGRLRSTIYSYVAVVFGWAAFFVFRLGIFHAGWDDDFHSQFFVNRRDVVTAIAVMKDSDDGFLLALHYADDSAFSFAVMPEAAHLDQNLVAMHGVANLWRRNKDISLELALGAGREGAGFAADEAVAVTMNT